MTANPDEKQRPPLFDLGRVVATQGALAALANTHTDALDLLARHATGDWGTICEEDKEQNAVALKQGWRVMSAYELEMPSEHPRATIWLITEADRSVTTFLLPKEY